MIILVCKIRVKMKPREYAKPLRRQPLLCHSQYDALYSVVVGTLIQGINNQDNGGHRRGTLLMGLGEGQRCDDQFTPLLLSRFAQDVGLLSQCVPDGILQRCVFWYSQLFR